MKEILYRAWREQTNEMFDVQSIVWDSNGEMCITLKEYSETSRNTTYPEDEVKLMQFTGLTDKNGVKIFEGDQFELPILSTLEEFKHTEILTVVFKNAAFCLENERRSMLLSNVQIYEFEILPLK